MQPDPEIWKPTTRQLREAAKKRVADVIAPDLAVLFVGINPGLYSAAIGHHFGRPGNRFWPALHQGGFTPRLFSPFEERELLTRGCGITNIVPRATATADQLTDAELRRGALRLRKTIRTFTPRFAAIVGIGAYRVAFDKPQAKLGRQDELIEGAVLWILPNPSGLNAHYQRDELARLFRELCRAAFGEGGGGNARPVPRSPG